MARLVLVAMFLGLGMGVVPCAAAENAPTREALVFFEREVRPLLVERCVKCHGPKKQSGKLRLDHLDFMLKGGETGPALVPGKPNASLLVEAIRHEGLEMPPNDRLPEADIARLVRWIELGAPWPPGETASKATGRTGGITAEDRQWWCFQPLRRPEVPVHLDSTWPQNEIDQFILAKLKSAGLSPALPATPAVLLRRIYFDLTGLPPAPADVASFTQACASGPAATETATAALVDRLLASEHYGQRWARHWLDLVRYADSDGYRIDDHRPHAWRYRDYVIRAFNADKPYDRFVQEQLAGDELFPGDPEALTATGYLRHWIYEYNNRDARAQWQTILDDITDTTSDVFLGLGLQCAKCHDHKFDPLLQRDYFRLQAFFAGLSPRDDFVAATASERAEYERQLAVWHEHTAELRDKLDYLEQKHRAAAAEEAITKFPDDIQAMIRKPAAQRDPQEHQIAELAYRQVVYEWDRLDKRFKDPEKELILSLRKQLAFFDAQKPPPLPEIMACTDLGPHAAPVFLPKQANAPIEPGFPTLLDERPAEIPALPGLATTGRRAALARWLTRPDHPLASRVMVNRIWQYHFGQGLAANASDFGRLGEPPSHPELLDWLASKFVAEGWSLKKLHREILLSATFAQASEHGQLALCRERDPENRLLWRSPVRRLEAEQIRDAFYATTGELDLNITGGPGAADESPRRSIFLRVMRNNRHPVLEAFDAPQWIQSAASRYATTTPVQSLLLFNSQFMLKRSEALALRLEREAGPVPANQIRRAYERAFARLPSNEELAQAEAFLKQQAGAVEVAQAASAEAKFLHEKLPFRDGQAAVVNDAQAPLAVAHADALSPDDFTIEAYFLLRSVYETGAVRTIASKWNGNVKSPGWSFGITGRQSRRKPQTLVLQLMGRTGTQEVAEAALFSDHHVQLNKPYYVAAAVKLARAGEPGSVAFFVKDLSNDDEPLLTASVPHDIRGHVVNNVPLIFGGRASANESRFDGLLDDIRFSAAPLSASELLYAAEGAGRGTLGYWKFEPSPDVFADASGQNRHITAAKVVAAEAAPTRQRQALMDFCHVLLNSNEFLYLP